MNKKERVNHSTRGVLERVQHGIQEQAQEDRKELEDFVAIRVYRWVQRRHSAWLILTIIVFIAVEWAVNTVMHFGHLAIPTLPYWIDGFLLWFEDFFISIVPMAAFGELMVRIKKKLGRKSGIDENEDA